MTLIADILMMAGALAAGFYCFVLSRRLSAFKDSESSIGQAVASLSAQVSELEDSVEEAKKVASASADSLRNLTKNAENVAQRLELMVASMHDLPEVGQPEVDRQDQEGPVFSTRLARSVG
ncbi:DUF6468 domain-containing protein [Planktotalea sp.]|uniref:DUF6468 domain-containing protein n=1 Tax=Planktotalea sp. TaxID=2029877 RepID=UPI003D6AB842